MNLNASTNLTPIGAAVALGRKNRPTKTIAQHKIRKRITLSAGVDLEAGQLVRLDGSHFIFEHATTDDEIVLKHERTGKVFPLSLDEFSGLHADNRLFVLARCEVTLPKNKVALLTMPLSAFEPKTRAEAMRKARFCIELDKARDSGEVKSLVFEELEPFIKKVAEERGLKTTSVASLIRWYGWWRAGHRRLSVMCHARAKRRATARMNEAVLAHLLDAIEGLYAQVSGTTLEDIRQAVRKALETEDEQDGPDRLELKPPALSTIARYVKNYNEYQITAGREGTYEANAIFEARGKMQIPTVPNALWEIDHTRIPIEVCFKGRDRNGNEVEIIIGHPWFTAVIDIHTRVIVAWELSMEPASSLRTMRVLKKAMLPKHELHQTYPELENRCDFFGITARVRADRGRDFFADAVAEALMDLVVELDQTHAYTPTEKPFIERFFWSLKRMLLRKIPGYVPKAAKRKPGRKKKVAKHLTIEQLDWAITRWIVDVYHQRPHAGLGGISPAEAWERGMERVALMRKKNPQLQVRSSFERSQEEFDLAFTIRRTRRLRNDGVRIFGFQYHSRELAQLVSAIGVDALVEVRADPANISSVRVFDPRPDHMRFITADCTEVEYTANLPLWSHNQLKGPLAKRLGRKPRKGDWGRASITLVSEILGLLDAGPKASRRDLAKAARHLGGRLDLGLLAAKLSYEADKTGQPMLEVAYDDLEADDQAEAVTPATPVKAAPTAPQGRSRDPFTELDR
ncbi:Mu transposase C-terminal domain-containing protein [Microvirga sp. 17 mud 1-3]|uniref:Mu transposase C-terminal domain-containing protein n=1 Tax=Microvirga sp. 17 mud 1-3 TaxID=2082949 RepID=UPI000D6DB2E6|nr:Mu transposase C-terminal domain-containing protein [Microvirga sp. 17 mud 1-3]AWM87089.1 hypothetical protein C4E04_10310 [Microvirga sp. 17 mud 1-3]